MADPRPQFEVTKAPEGPSEETQEFKYWKAFKHKVWAHSQFPITHIGYPTIGAPGGGSLTQSRQEAFVVTSGMRVQMYSVQTGRPIKTVNRFEDTARSGEVRRDGKVIVAGEDSGRIQVFDTSSRAILRTWTAHKLPVRTVKFCPTEMGRLASGSDDNTVRIWDLASNEPVRTITGHQGYVRSLSFMPGTAANLIVSGSYDSYVKVWDIRAPGKHVRSFKHPAPVEDVLASSAREGTIYAAFGKSVSVLDSPMQQLWGILNNHQRTVTSLCEASGGRRVLSGSLDGLVKIFESARWNVVSTLKYPAPILTVRMVSTGSRADAVDRHLVVGMQTGTLSVRSRPSRNNAAKERAREKEMEALTRVKMDERDAETKAKMKELSDKERLKIHAARAEAAGDVDLTLEADETTKQPKEKPWANYLKNNRYADALDSVLEKKSGQYSDENVLEVLKELKYRNAMHEAVKDRDEDSVISILRWMAHGLQDPALQLVCADVFNHVYELYAPWCEHSDRLLAEFMTVRRRVTEQIEIAQECEQLLGMIEFLCGGSLPC